MHQLSSKSTNSSKKKQRVNVNSERDRPNITSPGNYYESIILERR